MFGFKRNELQQNNSDLSNEINDINNAVKESNDDEIALSEQHKEALEIEKLFEHLTSFYSQPAHTQISLLLSGNMSKDEFHEDVKTQVRIYDFQKKLTKEIKEAAISKFIDSIWGYGILDELINNEEITDIKILSYDKINIKKNGKRERSNIKFKSLKDYTDFVDLVASKNKINLGAKNAIKVFTDKKTNPQFIMRFNITTAFINSSEQPCIHIRKSSKNKLTLDELIEKGMLDTEKKNYLLDKVKNASGIIFTGKGASGKTTLMNALLPYIPHDNSGLVIQESEELFDETHPDLMFQHMITNHGEGSVEYTLKDLAINGLLTDVDYFIIGEIKGGEAAYFLNASYTGHKCWCSVHGVNSSEAINKLADYVTYETNYARKDILNMLRFMEIIVFLEDFKIKEISQVTGYDPISEKLLYQRIY